ncbi:unnamed protein product [Prorocentrum cordatum]|uniref:Protein-serine/threonine kinase n=1 Tax=Prorocentrum cordatum TaxID=2364126 RepID=A0ABN9QAM1_9DINO|nr:unnamed protein product [Polarella glacialis]
MAVAAPLRALLRGRAAPVAQEALRPGACTAARRLPPLGRSGAPARGGSRLPRRHFCAGPGGVAAPAAPVPELVALLRELRAAAGAAGAKDDAPAGGGEGGAGWAADGQARVEAAKPQLQRVLAEAPVASRLELLRPLAALAALPGRPYAVASYMLLFLEEYTRSLGALRDGETISDRAAEIREVLLCFHRSGIAADRIRLLHEHVAQEFPRFEAAGALLPMPAAVRLCHTMLATGLSAPAAVVVLLRSALREPLLHVADDAPELRGLKTIEMLLRLDFLHTLEQLPKDVAEYLSVVRSLRYYDRDVRRDTALSYQLAFFLRKHGFPAERHMLGPYPLRVCDPEARINFEPVEERAWRPGLQEEPPARKRRHLEAVGWRSIEVTSSTWGALGSYESKAAHVRQLLKRHELLDA